MDLRALVLVRWVKEARIENKETNPNKENMRVRDNILHAARQGTVLRVRVFRKTCASEDRDR